MPELHMEPVTSPPDRPRGRAGALDWPVLVRQMKKNPGQWFKVATYRNKTNEGWRIRRGEIPEFREGRWDAVVETCEDHWVLYVCFEPKIERPPDAREARSTR